MDFGSRERKSPPTQFYRGYPQMNPLHFEAPQKPEPYRQSQIMETPRREEEAAPRRNTLIQEEREYFDGSSGRSGWRLSMYQSPKSGKVSTGKEKDRKPLDPPPFVQLTTNYQVDPTGSYISSPYYFMKSELVDSDLNPDSQPKPIHNGLSGTQVSSLYKLKDAHGNSGAFFTFGDMAVTKQGKFRLKFTLYERPFNPMDHTYLPEYVERSALFSPVFTAYPARTYPGLEQSTAKTQGFAEQGVRLRIRKESIAAGTRKRNLAVVDTSQEPSRDDSMRRRIAYTSAQMGGATTLALASPTQIVPTQGFTPTSVAQGGGHGGGGQEGYVWTPELQGLAPFTWNGSPIASAPPWQGHQGHGAQGPHGSQGH